MTASVQTRLTRLFTDDGELWPDSAALALPTDALRVRVEGVGTMPFPIRAPDARKLIGAARPAAFGQGEDTVHDLEVRDTWELTPAQVTLEGEHWDAHLDAALEEFRQALGLSRDSRLRAELHSMLVYGKGQFFLPHQDSEKHDDMVATLVVTLPSIHTGGELVVDDRGRKRGYRASREDLTLVAFYADRRHEVRPVRSGHRVTLTFNVLLEAAETPTESTIVERAAALLSEYFSTEIPRPYDFSAPALPRRLAVLLDHEYSQRGFSVRRLKGADAERVAVLLEAAEQADCEGVLALAEIQETRDAFADEYPAGGLYAPWVEDEEAWVDDLADVDPDYVGDVLDEETTLVWWACPDGSDAESISLNIAGDEVWAVTPSSELEPYQSEYEGYMGNYGNTIDRWYRRAAVILWPKARAFAARAEAGSHWALDTLQTEIAAGNVEQARTHARSLKPFWRRVDAALLDQALDVAVGLGDAQAAQVVLAPFRLEQLSAEQAPALAELFGQYGSGWWQAMLDLWSPRGWSATLRRETWIRDTLVPLVHALRQTGAHAGGEAADDLVGRVWKDVSTTLIPQAGRSHPSVLDERLDEVGQLTGCVMVAASSPASESIVTVLTQFDDSHLPLLLAVFRTAQDAMPAETDHDASSLSVQFTRVAEHCHQRLQSFLAQPERAADDWSISWPPDAHSGPGGSNDGDEAELQAFLRSPTEQTKVWPLAKPRRQRIHQIIDGAALPVKHVTRREGSPHKLILTKTKDLFRQEAAARRRASADLKWLTQLLE